MEIERFQDTTEETTPLEKTPIDPKADTIRRMIENVYRSEHSQRVKRGIATARAKRAQQNGSGGL